MCQTASSFLLRITCTQKKGWWEGFHIPCKSVYAIKRRTLRIWCKCFEKKINKKNSGRQEFGHPDGPLETELSVFLGHCFSSVYSIQ